MIENIIICLRGIEGNRAALLDLLLEAMTNDVGLTPKDVREEIDTFMFEVKTIIAKIFNHSKKN